MFTVGNSMDQFFSWFYYQAMNLLTDLQKYLGNMGLEIFDNAYAQGLMNFFDRLGWSLFIIGSVVAICECAIDAQSGGGNIKDTGINILTGFFAIELFAIVPVRLFALSVNVQSILVKAFNLVGYQADKAAQPQQSSTDGLISFCIGIFQNLVSPNPLLSWMTTPSGGSEHIPSFMNILFMFVFVFAVVKIIFDNLKRGAILLAQVCVCSLYMFSIPRGYKDGFFGWCKQVVGLCFTVFLQNMFLDIGLSIFRSQMIIGLGVMLGAAEIPRIAQQFGLDTSTKANVSGMSMAVNSIVNVGKTFAKAGA